MYDISVEYVKTTLTGISAPRIRMGRTTTLHSLNSKTTELHVK